MNQREIYIPGRILAEDEYLLKIQKHPHHYNDVGFLAKLNKDGSVPIRFEAWPRYSYSSSPTPVFVVKETFQEGWRIEGCRFGESQNWAIMLHPDGYTLEIHMIEFIKIIQTITVKDGNLIGKFKWSGYGELLQPSL